MSRFRRVAMRPLPSDLEAELRTWGDLEPQTECSIREKLYTDRLRQMKTAEHTVARFSSSYPSDVLLLAIAYALGPWASAIFLTLTLVELYTRVRYYRSKGTPSAPSQESLISTLFSRGSDKELLADIWACSFRAAALCLLCCTGVTGYSPAAGDRLQTMLSYPSTFLKENLGIAFAFAIVVASRVKAITVEDAPPSTKTVDELMKTYQPPQPTGPRRSPRLRI